MPSWLRKMHAKAVLASLFFVQLFKRVFLFWRRPGGVAGFLANYGADGISLIGEQERNDFPSFQWCQTCSLCTFSCEAIKLDRAPAAFEPKFLMLGFGRSAHESEFFSESWLPCAECSECTVLCPNDVPIHKMAHQIIERRKSLGFRS